LTESTPPPEQRWSDPTAPQVSANAYSPAGTAAEPRPGLVTWGSITLIALGALTAVIGLVLLLGGAVISSDPRVLIGVAIVLLLWGAAEIWAAIKALAGRNWARITGIVLAGLGALFTFLGILGSLFAVSADAGVSGLILNVALLAAYAFAIYAYATAGRWFSSRTT